MDGFYGLFGFNAENPNKKNDEDIAAEALYKSYQAYIRVGFTEDQAYGLLCTMVHGAAEGQARNMGRN